MNEQANAGLGRIKGQLAYMSLDNFMFHLCLFLSIKNSDCRSKLDVGRLCIIIIMMVTFIKCIMYNSLLATCVFALMYYLS